MATQITQQLSDEALNWAKDGIPVDKAIEILCAFTASGKQHITENKVRDIYRWGIKNRGVDKALLPRRGIKNNPLTRQQKQAIRTMAEAGTFFPDLVNSVGLPKNVVEDWMARNGIKWNVTFNRADDSADSINLLPHMTYNPSRFKRFRS